MTAKKKFFEAELKVLIKEFEDGWTDTESDASIGAAMLEFIFRYVRLQHGVLNQPERWPELDIDTLHKLFSWDSSDPCLQLIQNVLKRFSVGREVDAVTLLKAAVQSKLDSFSKQQSKNAKTPRKPTPLQKRIEEIVARRPDITCAGLFEQLESESRNGGLIEDIDDEYIYLQNDKLVRISALKDRLSRAKKKLKISKKSR